VGADEDRIVSGLFELLDDPAAYAAMSRAHNPFGDGRSAEIIGRIIAS
jgi:UDP-N-acetylglucosamine 2-epimerase (non-hydrolysing)